MRERETSLSTPLQFLWLDKQIWHKTDQQEQEKYILICAHDAFIEMGPKK